MGPSLFPWGSWEKPRHHDTRRSHVLGQFPQGRPTPSPYQTTTPSTSHPNSSSALGDPAASGDLRLGHRAPGRGGRRASIPLHALTILLSVLGAFCLWEFRVFSTNLNILRSIYSGHGDPARARQRRRPPAVHRGSTHAPRLQRPVASEDEASACSELRSVVTRKRPSLNRAKQGQVVLSQLPPQEEVAAQPAVEVLDQTAGPHNPIGELLHVGAHAVITPS